MNQALMMQVHVHDKIINALSPLGLSPHEDGGDVLIYQLEYESGLTLSVGIVCVEMKKFVFFKEYALGIIVHEIDESRQARTRHLSDFIPLPKSEHDITFDLSLSAKFTSMTRAVADVLRAGECITMGRGSLPPEE